MPSQSSATLIIGHRGARRLAIENTLESIRIALAEGAHGVEFDVQQTSDGELVLFHDDDLRRVAHCEGRVTALPWREVRALRLRLPGLADQPVAHLDEVLELLDARKATCNVELKVDPAAGTGVRLAEAFARRVEGQDMTRYLVSSFQRAPLQRLHDGGAGLALAALIDARPPCDWWALAAEQPAPDAQDLAHQPGIVLASVNPAHNLVNPDRLARWRASGWQVWTWTVNAPKQWEAMLQAGVDAIITDDPGALVRHR